MVDRGTRILAAARRVIARRGVRGLRVEEVAREAGVSNGLLYYHFRDRNGILRATLDYVNDRAAEYTSKSVPEADPRRELESTLLTELQDDPEVIENSSAWGELRASALFEPALREPLRETTRNWNSEITELILATLPQSRRGTVTTAARDSAEQLTALIEGLSHRWLSESLALEQARELLRGAVSRELTALDSR